jgi:hypothetical protein
MHPEFEQISDVSRLPLELLAEIFNRLADFATAATEAFLHVSGGLVGHALVVKALIVSEVPGCLLHFALHLVEASVEFIFIHRVLLPDSTSYKIRAVPGDLVR